MIQYFHASNKPVPFDSTGADLSGFMRKLRSKAMVWLSQNEVILMLKQQDFYDANKYKIGKGLAHLYESHHNNEVVMDYATGLMWQQSGSENYLTYEDAPGYIQKLNQQHFAGYNDWRLPTLEEAMSLMESKKHGDLYIDRVFDHKQRWIWTSDHYDESVAWYVDFYYGFCISSSVYGFTFVRAVRSG